MHIRRVFAVLLPLVLFIIGLRPTLDPDMWWHLRTGERIFESGIPRSDPFSFTVPGREWITHEWLSECLMWIAYRAGGFPGLMIAFAGIAALAYWLVYRVTPGRPYLAGALTIVAAFAASPMFGARPQVLNLLLTAVFVFLIESWRSGRLPRSTWIAFPLLSALWVNLHGGYLIGVALLLTCAAGEALDARLDSNAERKERARLLALAGVLSLAAGILNPNHVRLWTYAFGTLGSDLMQDNIAEWQSPDFHNYGYWPFPALFALCVLGWVFRSTRPSWSDLLLAFSTAAAGLLSSRHIAVFALVALPIAGRSWNEIVRRSSFAGSILDETPGRPVPPGAQKLNRAILGVGALLLVVWTAVRVGQNRGAVEDAFPVGAVDFMEREGLSGERCFNSYAWGGYLIWRGIPVFVDGRADVYGDFLARYLKTLRLTRDWRAPLDEFSVNCVLIERAHPLGTLLGASQGWVERYDDDVARVFARDSPLRKP